MLTARTRNDALCIAYPSVRHQRVTRVTDGGESVTSCASSSPICCVVMICFRLLRRRDLLSSVASSWSSFVCLNLDQVLRTPISALTAKCVTFCFYQRLESFVTMAKLLRVLSIKLLVFAFLAWHVRADVFTSMSDMHTLLDTESEIIRTMEDYITTQEAKLLKLRKDVAEMGALHRKASQSPDQFLGHPINAFLLVKRLTLDWADWQSTLTSDPVGQAVLANFSSRGEGVLKWPDEEDLSGVATALMRLQDTYQLDTSRMAEGYINDMPPAYKQLSSSDCFELGRQSYNQGDHYHTILWMSEALSRLEDEKDAPPSESMPSSPVTKADILEYLAFSNYMQGHVRHALQLTDELIELRPDHQRALGNKAYYEEALKNTGDGRRGEDGRLLQDEAVQKGYTVQEETEDVEQLGAGWQREREAYERLCRGDVHVHPVTQARLTCHYQVCCSSLSGVLLFLVRCAALHCQVCCSSLSGVLLFIVRCVALHCQVCCSSLSGVLLFIVRCVALPCQVCCSSLSGVLLLIVRCVALDCQYGPHALLRIAPVRAEVTHINPTITVYHNVLSDEEIASIKRLALPRFKRATVQNYKTGALETASYRISKSAWLKEEDDVTVAKVNKRIASITGLEMSTAEELQVANYGVGGHYEPHYDYARREEKDAFKSLGTGNRIATFLFYMSEVTGGGATVFPQIETALWPRKGSAAFWYNLYPNGEGDPLTRHAACPVLLGEKWVSNKWIHERGQELIRRCDVDRNAL
ncbi:Prolyl 4-hydroxylase alpha-subunit N-terminal [Trinorchestia longiramus]|nr:Prolyl 4-hydroxylase alpha-subunit N-terminal [Trinorchestia longiramus]